MQCEFTVEIEFKQLAGGEFGRARHGETPKTYDLAGVPVKVLFAPDHTPELEIMKQMLKGASEVVFAIFTFAGSSGIDDTMVARSHEGACRSAASSTADRQHMTGRLQKR